MCCLGLPSLAMLLSAGRFAMCVPREARLVAFHLCMAGTIVSSLWLMKFSLELQWRQVFGVSEARWLWNSVSTFLCGQLH